MQSIKYNTEYKQWGLTPDFSRSARRPIAQERHPRSRIRVRNLSVLCFLFLSVQVFAGGNEAGTVWDGVYTVVQAERGEAIYKDEDCELCHAATMRGGPAARGLVGVAFQFLWKDKTLDLLFEATRTKMPPGNPGTLDDQEYLDVLAAVLQRNGFPAGTAELAPDLQALQAITLTWENPE